MSGSPDTPPSTEVWYDPEDDDNDKFVDAGEIEASSVTINEQHQDQDQDQDQDNERTGVTIEEIVDKDSKKAAAAKERGNSLFQQHKYQDSVDCYQQAVLLCPDDDTENMAIFYGNLAAAQLMLERWQEALDAANSSLELKADYPKVLRRRAKAAEQLDDLEQALTDHQKLLELDPSDRDAKLAVKRLTPLVEAKREKMKEEMIGKMKDLGNTLLGKFGMSLDNFKAVQDPATGSYSISYNPSKA